MQGGSRRNAITSVRLCVTSVSSVVSAFLRDTMKKKLPRFFYTRDDVLQISKELLGKVLVTNFDGIKTSGIIVETEAYQGVVDRAAHSFGGRRTQRTEVMYAIGGTAYVYLIYGIHHLFNVVTGAEGTPTAALVRALEPLEGIDTMLYRRDKLKLDYTLTKGPGALAKALGIHKRDTGKSLLGNEIWIEDRGIAFDKKQIAASPRIGVDYAGEHALWDYRFYVKGNPWVSGKKTTDNRHQTQDRAK